MVDLQKIVWSAGEGCIPCWWGGSVNVEDGDNVFLYESPTTLFFHGVEGKAVNVPTMTRQADG